MEMFCFQCQETSDRRGCTTGGVCGKTEETANYRMLPAVLVSFFAASLSGVELLSSLLLALGIAVRAAAAEAPARSSRPPCSSGPSRCWSNAASGSS